MLPADQAAQLLGLWNEFEAYETAEAKFAHTLDNCQPLMLNDASSGKSWEEHQVHESAIAERNARTGEGSARIWQYMQKLIARNVQEGHIRRDR
jgi:putative hydrolase of HD superfamily